MSVRQARLLLAGSGLGLLACGLASAALSPGFDPAIDLKHQPIIWLTALQFLAGLFFLLLLPALKNHSGTAPLLVGILALGLVLRLVTFGATPPLETDHNRYLWEGAVAAAGENPYATAPQEAAQSKALAPLAAQAGPVFENINHPHLTTIYPLGAQAAFALAHTIAPFDLDAWRGLLLAADFITFLLLFLILRQAGRPLAWAALYWWNPLVIQQGFAGAHMDLLILPFLLAGLWAALQRRPIWAAAAITLAATIKLWPLLLLPLVARPLLSQPKRLAGTLLLCGTILGLALWPQVTSLSDGNAGLALFGQTWAANDAFFQALSWLLGFLPGLDASLTARALVALALGALGVALALRAAPDADALLTRTLVLVAALFLIAPVQFPWYATWFAPLLALRPAFPLLLLTPLLSLYYLRFYFAARGQPELFDHGIVWLEFLPVWMLLAWQGLKLWLAPHKTTGRLQWAAP